MEEEFDRKVFSVDVDYDPNTGSVLAERWKNQSGDFERLGDQPAVVEYFPNSNTISQLRWHNGDYPDGPHRDGDNPARIMRYEDGTAHHSYWKRGKLHRSLDQGPAVIIYDRAGNVLQAEYWLNDELVRKPTPSTTLDI